MRILIVTRNLPPLVGGMERLNWHMADELSKRAEARIVGPEGSAAQAPEGVEIREVPLRPLWKFLWRARALARREAKAWKPDIVLAGSGLTAPIAQSAARACGARTAVYVHGLDVAVKHPVYRALWFPAIRKADRVIANSRATARLCSDIGVDPTRMGIVHPGVDLPAGGPEGLTSAATVSRSVVAASAAATGGISAVVGGPEGPIADFRQRHDLANHPLLVSVGRLSARKGLREFVAQALPGIVAASPDILLLIVGDAPSQALHAEAQTPDAIRAAATAAGVDGHVRFIGKVSDPELEAAFRAANVHVFPVREIPGDPEGFGMVAVEAAAHGLPTVAFDSGGVGDAVAEGISGHLVPPGDYTAFADAVIATLGKREALRASCIEFARQFAWPAFGTQIAQQLRIV